MSSLPLSCSILGGANGSGKSTIYAKLHLDGELVNADIIARQIAPDNPESATAAAGRRVIQRLDQLLSARQNFVYETTLSSHQSIKLMERTRDAGYGVNLAFVVLRDLELNVLRVAERVMQGGHSIPERTIRRRYAGAFEKLPRAIAVAHRIIVYDNSRHDDLETLIQISDGRILFCTLNEASLLHRRVAERVGSALNIGVDSVFKAAMPPGRG